MENTPPLLIALIAAVVTNVISALIMVFSSRAKDIKANTHAVIKLTTQMEMVFRAVQEVPKMKADLNEAHKKLRELQ